MKRVEGITEDVNMDVMGNCILLAIEDYKSIHGKQDELERKAKTLNGSAKRDVIDKIHAYESARRFLFSKTGGLLHYIDNGLPLNREWLLRKNGIALNGDLIPTEGE